MNYKMTRLILQFAELGIQDHCDDPKTRNILLEFMDNVYDILGCFEDETKVLNKIEEDKEYGTIDDCFGDED